MVYLVTGGMGYIGSYVVRNLLSTGKEVVCLDNAGVTPIARLVIGQDNMKRVKVIQGDVGNTLQLFDIIREQKIDLIIHMAYVVPPTTELKPAYAINVNCMGMTNVLEATRLFNLRRVVWVSSIMALGRIADFCREPIADDEAVYAPTFMYGATKAMNEIMARHYFDRFGTDSIGFRLPTVYGIGRWHGIVAQRMEFFKRAALNIPDTIGDANLARGFVYVEDVSNIIVKACDAPTTKTRIFNVVEGYYTNAQIVEAIRKINPQAKVAAEDRGEIARDYWQPKLDATGVRTELGWQPKYSLNEGLRIVLNYFRQQEGLPLL